MWLHIEFILYHAYSLIITFLLPCGYLHLIVQMVGRASHAECSSEIYSELRMRSTLTGSRDRDLF